MPHLPFLWMRDWGQSFSWQISPDQLNQTPCKGSINISVLQKLLGREVVGKWFYIVVNCAIRELHRRWVWKRTKVRKFGASWHYRLYFLLNLDSWENFNSFTFLKLKNPIRGSKDKGQPMQPIQSTLPRSPRCPTCPFSQWEIEANHFHDRLSLTSWIE